MFKVGDVVEVFDGGVVQRQKAAGHTGKQFTITHMGTSPRFGDWASGNAHFAATGFYTSNLKLVVKIGDMVEITRFQYAAKVGDVVKVVSVDAQGGILYKSPESRTGTFVADAHAFKLVGRAEDQKTTDPAPVLFANHGEASEGESVDVEYHRRTVHIQANYDSFESTKKNIDNDVIYMQAGGGVGLTIDEAKQVAVALFNQILYHEGIRNGEITS